MRTFPAVRKVDRAVTIRVAIALSKIDGFLPDPTVFDLSGLIGRILKSDSRAGKLISDRWIMLIARSLLNLQQFEAAPSGFYVITN